MLNITLASDYRLYGWRHQIYIYIKRQGCNKCNHYTCKYNNCIVFGFWNTGQDNV